MEIFIGKVEGKEWGYKSSLPVSIEFDLKDGKKGLTFSASANFWKPNMSDCETCGQCLDNVESCLLEGTLTLNSKLTKQEILKLIKIWKVWHLNDLNAECEHQRKLKPKYLKKYGKDFFNADNYNTILTCKEFKKCSVCGYQYGTEWKFRELSKGVIKFVKGLLERFIK